MIPGYAPRAETRECALCGHMPACGFAEVVDDRDARRERIRAFMQGFGSILDLSGRVLMRRPPVKYVRLCHSDDHSCYHQWTVYKKRPQA